MEHNATRDRIFDNYARLDKDSVQRILVLYEEKILFIGDFCVRFDKLLYFRNYFNGASVDINFSLKENKEVYEGLLTSNPNVSNLFSASNWDELAFHEYDLIFCVAYDEVKFLQYLHERYGPAIANDEWKACVLSVSELLISPGDFKIAFPVKEDMVEYVRVMRPGEIYISDEERQWANRWLESKGMRENEQLYIVLDSTSRRSKLMGIHVYFELLKFLLSKKNVRLLTFDEKNIGKEAFYREWLGPALSERFIFGKGLRLRESLRVLASSYTRMIFGPCTGLLHCASGMYNHFLNTGMPESQAPLIVAYTGHYIKNEGNANLWWGHAPLVNCLLLQETDGRKQPVLLSSLSEKERESYTQIPASEYTANMFIDFLSPLLSEPRQATAVAAY